MTILIVTIIVIVVVAMIIKNIKKLPNSQNNKIFKVLSLFIIVLSIIAIGGTVLYIIPQSKVGEMIGNAPLGLFVLVIFVFPLVQLSLFLIERKLFIRMKEKKQSDKHLFVISCVFFLVSFIIGVVCIFNIMRAFEDFGFNFVLRYIS